jgi:hypothetical protein
LGRGRRRQTRLWNTIWLARVEYLHYDFGDSGNLSTGFAGATPPAAVIPSAISMSRNCSFFLTNSTTSRHLTADVVRAGLDYKFN